MGLFDLIHMYNAFVNDYLLTLSKSRRLRNRQDPNGVKALAVVPRESQRHGFDGRG